MSNQHQHHPPSQHPDHPTHHPAPRASEHPTPQTTEHAAPHPTPRAAELEKEFELERMVLFTDAVFAIAITLLVIDLKWPDLQQEHRWPQLLHLLRPTIFGFMAFTTSFLYIGRSWSVHLRLFRLVRKYDQGLINRNLFFLFFIVAFPFANAGLTEHGGESFALPFVVYMANLAFLGIAHYRLCRYIILKKTALSVEGRNAEKKFVLTRGRYMMFATCATPLVAAALWLLFPDHPVNTLYSFVFLLLALKVAKHRLKAIYPADSDNE